MSAMARQPDSVPRTPACLGPGELTRPAYSPAADRIYGIYAGPRPRPRLVRGDRIYGIYAGPTTNRRAPSRTHVDHHHRRIRSVSGAVHREDLDRVHRPAADRQAGATTSRPAARAASARRRSYVTNSASSFPIA